MGRPERFAVIGAGIGGLSVAIAMQRKGFHVTVYERAPAIKPLGAGLLLAANAINAFQEIGIREDILKAGSMLTKLCIKDQQGKILTSTDAEKLSTKFDGFNNFTIHRSDLHDALLQCLKEGTVQLDKSTVDFTQSSNDVRISFLDGTFTETDYVIACDGIHSVFRQKLLPESMPRYAGYTCWRAVIDKLPPSLAKLKETTETWAAAGRFGIAPLNKGRLYWFACVNAKQNDALKRAYTIEDLRTYFQDFHDPIPEILRHTKSEQLIWSDIIDIKPVKQFAFSNVVLMGDAAHATTPNMGQGACMAIEDAAVLANTIERTPSVVEAFKIFEQKRLKRTTTIINGSWNLGRVAQLENPLLIGLRNTVLRLTPQSVAEKQVKFLHEVEF